MASTAAPSKHEFIVILPDQSGALERRMSVRPAHLENLKPKVDSDFYRFGGAFMEEVPKEGERPKILGSVMLAYAESAEAVLEDLKKDVYSEGQVWDWTKVQIYPFRTAIFKPS